MLYISPCMDEYLAPDLHNALRQGDGAAVSGGVQYFA